MNLHRAVFTDKNILVQKHQQHGHSYGLVAVHLKLIRHYADFRLLMMQLPLIAVEGKVHQIVGCGGTECILHGGRHAPGIGHGMDHPPSRPIIGLGRLFPRLHQLPGQFQKWLMVLRQPDPLCQPILLLLRVQMPVSVLGGWISSDQIPCRLEGKPPFWEEPISRCRANPRYRFHKPVSSPPCLALRIRSGKGSPCAVSGCSGSKYTFALPAWF